MTAVEVTMGENWMRLKVVFRGNSFSRILLVVAAGDGRKLVPGVEVTKGEAGTGFRKIPWAAV